MDLVKFFDGLEQIYNGLKPPEQAETYMKQGIEEAAFLGDGKAVFAIINELMGFYRVHSRFEECFLCIEQAMHLAELLGLKGTVDYGTMLLNVATGCRAAGKYEEAGKYYHEVQKIYQDKLPDGDYRMASLYNNLSLLSIETGYPEKALKELEKAMTILRGITGTKGEMAVTHTNMGTTLFQLGRIIEGTRHMEEAVNLFEQFPDKKDSHYPAALAGLGEAYYRKGNLKKSVEYFGKSLKETQHILGNNKDSQIIQKNLAMVQELLNRQKAAEGISGMELSRQYYQDFGEPMLKAGYPDYLSRIAVGLVGEGSECMGFDDKFSADHDFGAGFCLWLTKEDFQAIGDRLQEDYRRLPKIYRGLEVKNLSPYGADRVGVFCIDDFFRKYTGYDQAPAKENDWMTISQEGLCAVTNGEIFRDDLGLFRKRQEEFRHFPFRVRQKKLAAALGRMAQSGQYNLGRARNRGDIGAMYFSLSEFIQAAVETVYLLNDSYMPFYKWRMRGMERLGILREIKDRLEALMQMGLMDEALSEEIEIICHKVVRELSRQGISDRRDSFLEHQKKRILERIEEDINGESFRSGR